MVNDGPEGEVLSPRKVMMGDSSKETGKVPIGKNPSSVFTISILCQDDEIGNVSLVIRRRMKKNKKGKLKSCSLINRVGRL